jgi:uncharacterized protein (DUF302 family)
MKFGMRKELTTSFDETLARVPDALRAEGFGVLTEIDVQDTLRQKLGVEFRRYRILGACNPPLAHRALSAELEIGLMLPCNVIVYEKPGGGSVVAAIDPLETIAATGSAELREVAAAVRGKLERMLAQIG